jgi:soluble lytic murein transglycosylase-like protein
MRARLALAALLAMQHAAGADPNQIGPGSSSSTVCQSIDQGAAEYNLPADFFARLIWRESRLQPDAVSPKGAQGIAQFMPQTAALRGLADPFDAAASIAASAHYLSDLVTRFGNLGLAAAAYNAGEQRVSAWLSGTAGLPTETEDYVLFITGHGAEEWKGGDPTAGDGGATPAAPPTCTEVVALLAQPGAGAAAIAAPRTTASWAP